MKSPRIMKSREPKSTCYKVSLSAPTSSELKPSSPASINKWSPEPDTLEIHIRSSISLNYHLVKSCKPLGTESSSSLEDLPSLKWRTPNHSQIQPFSIRSQLHHYQMLVTPTSWCAQLFALIWVAFPCPISEPTRVGFACVTVPSTISSEESDKDQLKTTCHTLTTPCTDQLCVLKSKSSPTSHQSSYTFEQCGVEAERMTFICLINIALSLIR